MKRLSAFCIVYLFVRASSQAATPDDCYSEGRAFLAAHDLTNANARFACTVAQAPNHTNANVLFAVTRLLVLQEQPAGKALLDRLGLDPLGRSPYAWTADLPRDDNGLLLAPTNFSAAELSSYLRTTVLPQIIAAGTNLALVTDPNYMLSLTSNETATIAVTLDYADLLLIRAVLKAAEYAAYTVDSWNADLQLVSIRDLLVNGSVTAQTLLAQHPNLFKFASTNDLQFARQSFTNAETLYLNASALIRGRPPNTIRLFNYEPSQVQKEEDFRSVLFDLNRSLAGPVVLTLDPAYVVNLSNHFTGIHPPRDFFPQISGNAIVAGSLPDPTFDGVIQGAPAYVLESALGKAVSFISRFTVPRRLPDGRIELTLDALDNSFFLIQVSTNLQGWADLTNGVAHQGILSFTDPNATARPRAFYRALDRSGWLSVGGQVFNVANGSAIPNAIVVVISGSDAVTNHSDSAGNFLTITELENSHYYELQIVAQGYASFHSYGDLPSEQHFSGRFGLAPTGSTAPNDDFAQCQTISGTNAVVFGSNIGASWQTGELVYGNGSTVWWCWTAPVSGAATIDTVGSSFVPVVSVRTGTSVSSLTHLAGGRTPDGPDTEVTFFVTQGVTYRICVDGTYGVLGEGQVVLHLRMAAATAPVITVQPHPSIVAAGGHTEMFVQNTGTEPMFYQWRRNGAPIPGQLSPEFVLGLARTTDAGVYSVIVSNAAGSVISSNASLTVVTIPPRITKQPAPFVAGVGDHASFRLQAVAAPEPSIQWLKAGSPILNETNNWYEIASVQAGDAGSYSAVVSNQAGVAISSNVALTVITTPPPNDSFGNRISIVGLTNTVLGSNYVASKEAGEPDHAGLPGGRSVWWTWTAPTNGPVTLDVRGSSFSPLLAVYTGGSVTSLSLVASNAFGGVVNFYASAGAAYQIAVDSFPGNSGLIRIDLGMGSVRDAQSESGFELLHTFAPYGTVGSTNSGGAESFADLLEGQDGRLYGVTISGGSGGSGVVFAIAPNGLGFTVLHAFSVTDHATNSDGAASYGALIQGTDGRLYGMTAEGGTNGTGTIFSLGTNGAGFTVLHSFERETPPNYTNIGGAYPYGALLQGQDGRLYGTAIYGGSDAAGTLFAINTNGSGFIVLHTFHQPDYLPEGSFPNGPLIQGADFRLYGTTSEGGKGNAGTVFCLRTNGTGFTLLFGFGDWGDPNGAYPYAGLLQGKDGRLYGSAAYGGVNNGGTLFCLRTNGAGFTALHTFTVGDPDTGANLEGVQPNRALRQGKDGRLYGTAPGGGPNAAGTIFSLTPSGSDFALVHSFEEADGAAYSGLIQGRDSRLFGVAPYSGTNGTGTIFAIAPMPPELHIIGRSNRAVVSWPFWAGAYLLETRGSLTGGAWTPLTNGVGSVGDSFVLTNILNPVPTYFRLRKP